MNPIHHSPESGLEKPSSLLEEIRNLEKERSRVRLWAMIYPMLMTIAYGYVCHMLGTPFLIMFAMGGAVMIFWHVFSRPERGARDLWLIKRLALEIEAEREARLALVRAGASILPQGTL